MDGEWRGRKLWSMVSTTGRVGWGVLQELWECPMQSEALARLSPKSGSRRGNGRKPKTNFLRFYILYAPGRGWKPNCLPLPRGPLAPPRLSSFFSSHTFFPLLHTALPLFLSSDPRTANNLLSSIFSTLKM